MIPPHLVNEEEYLEIFISEAFFNLDTVVEYAESFDLDLRLYLIPMAKGAKLSFGHYGILCVATSKVSLRRHNYFLTQDALHHLRETEKIISGEYHSPYINSAGNLMWDVCS